MSYSGSFSTDLLKNYILRNKNICSGGYLCLRRQKINHSRFFLCNQIIICVILQKLKLYFLISYFLSFLSWDMGYTILEKALGHTKANSFEEYHWCHDSQEWRLRKLGTLNVLCLHRTKRLQEHFQCYLLINLKPPQNCTKVQVF